MGPLLWLLILWLLGLMHQRPARLLLDPLVGTQDQADKRTCVALGRNFERQTSSEPRTTHGISLC